MDVPILFQDDRFVILNKPPGLPVHPGPSSRPGGGPSPSPNPSIEDCFPSLSRRRTGPWLAHRLDADTAGCLVIALRRAALHQAQACFANGTVRKTYWAIVEGTPAHPQGQIDAPLIKRNTRQGWHMATDPAGQPARTTYRTLGQTKDLTWLELHPQTGRTHQIRVHCAALGTPILGDPRYGIPPHKTNPDPGRPRLHLLARAIQIPLTPPLTAAAPPPAHMHPALRLCGWNPTERSLNGL